MKISKHHLYSLFSVLTLISIAACDVPEQIDSADFVSCTAPRPEICTQNYLPVCGAEDLSIQSSWKTYPNACAACAITAISAYKEGLCKNN